MASRSPAEELDVDGVTLVAEEVDDEAGTYRRDGDQVRLTTRREVIKVAGGDDVEITVRSTLHGPIMSDVMTGIAEAGDDVAALRAMWSDAQARGASEAILNDIKTAATTAQSKEN